MLPLYRFCISIPYGSIKSFAPILKQFGPQVFQFLMVRLKAEESTEYKLPDATFQFLMVRLKASIRSIVRALISNFNSLWFD